MTTDDSDNGIFPDWLIYAFGVFVAGAMGYALLFTRPREPYPPPHSLEGCYSTAGGPILSFYGGKLTIQQSPPIEIDYSVEYAKGWTFQLSRELIYSRAANGQLTLLLGRNHGMYLIVSREGEVASRLPAFDLFDRKSYKVRYEWSGAECGAETKS